MLPSQSSHFSQAEYWNEFFVARKTAAKGKGKSSAFEWYGDFNDDLLHLVRDFHKSSDTTLVLGCGNSSQSEELLRYECASKVISVDFSEKAIEEMKEKTKTDTRLVWVLADVTKLPPDYEVSFDTVWDKGALDALLGEVDGDDTSLEAGRLMLSEAHRCLRPNGLYFCVSLLQAHVLRTILDCAMAGNQRWESLHLMPFNPKAGSALCTFLIVMRKGGLNVPPKLVVTRHPNAEPQELKDRKALEEVVQETQVAYGARRSLNMPGKGLRGTFSIMSVANPTNERFHLQVIDTTKRKLPFAALILPQGREHEWNFSHEDGQLQIAESNEIGRLIFVSLGRNEVFAEGMEGVQRELSSSILEFAPADLPKGFKIPYLAVAQDLGQRKIVLQAESALSGPFTVEDVTIGEETHRRLIFLNNPLAIQSESRVRGNEVDLDYLSFDFHRAMAALGFANKPKVESALICGVGGGGLLSFLARRFPQSVFEGVEIDPAVVELARTCFSLPAASKVYVTDAYEFVQTKKEQKDLDLIFLDINGGMTTSEKEQTSLRFPPPQFLELDFLQHVRDKALKSDSGMLIMNFGCRSEDMTKTLLKRVQKVFGSVIALDMSEVSGDLNIILCCSKGLNLTNPQTIEAFVQACSKENMLDGLRLVKDDGTMKVVPSSSSGATSKRTTKKKKKKN